MSAEHRSHLSCKTCKYVLQSESSNTGLRCGHDYFHGHLFLRKVRLMSYYPIIHDYNLCEKYRSQEIELNTIDPLSA
jgi:hypothetical protein